MSSASMRQMLGGYNTLLARAFRSESEVRAGACREVLKFSAVTMVDSSIVKAIEDEGFLKKLK